HDYRHVEVPRERVTVVFKETTIIKNTYVYNDNRIVVNGIPRERVERVTNRKVETVHIRDERAESGRAIPREQRNGNELAVYRPQVKATASVTPQVAEKRREER